VFGKELFRTETVVVVTAVVPCHGVSVIVELIDDTVDGTEDFSTKSACPSARRYIPVVHSIVPTVVLGVKSAPIVCVVQHNLFLYCFYCKCSNLFFNFQIYFHFFFIRGKTVRLPGGQVRILLNIAKNLKKPKKKHTLFRERAKTKALWKSYFTTLYV
jgi:hypothetical protein